MIVQSKEERISQERREKMWVKAGADFDLKYFYINHIKELKSSLIGLFRKLSFSYFHLNLLMNILKFNNIKEIYELNSKDVIRIKEEEENSELKTNIKILKTENIGLKKQKIDLGDRNIGGFITLDESKDEFMKYKWNESENSYKSIGSSLETSGKYPSRGDMNTKGIYVLPDMNSFDIGFYDLYSFEISSTIIKSQSGKGHYGSCGFMDDDIVICVTQTTGHIYKYNITNNYTQVRIAHNNPSQKGFESVLLTQDKKYILAAYYGCIYIYNSSGTYIGNSDNTR